ncbi:MAG: hypothetical protein ACOZB3_00970 [Calditrichota bacterium]
MSQTNEGQYPSAKCNATLWIVTLLLVTGVLANEAAATKPAPYIGGGIGVSIVCKDRHYPKHLAWLSAPTLAGDTYGGPGMRIEGGLLGRCWDLHGETACEIGFDGERRWSSLCVGIGSRLRLSDRVRYPLKPFIGAGLTSGWVKYTYLTYKGKTSQSSKLSGGYYAEVGLMTVGRTAFRPGLTVRIERLNSQIGFYPKRLPGAYYFSLMFCLFGLLS